MAQGRAGLVRSMLGRALAIGLTIAAATAIVALLTGSFDETEWRIISTSIGFSVFSATAAAGEGARGDGRRSVRASGTAAVALSAASFALLLFAIWLAGDEQPWQAGGVVAVATLVASHASLVLKARRASDGPLIRALVATSIGAALLD